MLDNIKKNLKNLFQDKFNLLLLLIFILGNVINFGYFFNWFMLTITCYTLIANNYIQSIGTFLINNKNKFKSNLIFITLSFTITTLISWIIFDGNIDYNLLSNIEYKKNLGIVIIFIPMLLNIFTKYGIPVSATFLVIPLFSDNNTLNTMLTKTVTSYFLAFIVSFFIWNFIKKHFSQIMKMDNKENTFWNITEYITTSLVWIAWNMLNICVFVVFVDRKFNFFELVAVNIIVLVVLYIILKGDNTKIEEIINEKNETENKKSIAIFNLLFALILIFIEFFSNVPLTTTWVFLGLLAGKELSESFTNNNIFSNTKIKKSLIKIIKDLHKAMVGIIFSLLFVKIILFFC